MGYAGYRDMKNNIITIQLVMDFSVSRHIPLYPAFGGAKISNLHHEQKISKTISRTISLILKEKK